MVVVVAGSVSINANNAVFVDIITPRPHMDTPIRVQVNGDLSVGSNGIFAENTNSDWHVKTKYLETTKASYKQSDWCGV